MKFSLKNQAFYEEDVDYGSSLPDDAIEISATQYQQFYDALNSGSVIYDASGVLTISPSRPNQYVSWVTETASWVMTDTATEQQEEDEKAALMAAASSEFARATDQIGVLSDKIELSDYVSSETADSVTAELKQWKTYRIACNNVIKGASNVLPAAPDA